MTTYAALIRYSLVGSATILVLVMGLAACAGGDPATSHQTAPAMSGRELVDVVSPLGATSLKERIARSDVVAKVRLQSVAAGAVRWDSDWNEWPGTHVGTMEHRLRVLEYLKGSGGNEITAVAYDDNLSLAFGTAELARAHGKALVAGRDTRWDARDAIVFLRADRPWLPDFPQQGRYVLGHVSTDRRADFYSIDSPWDKTWLPAETSGGAAGASGTSGTQRFLLDAPVDAGTGGASGQSEGTPTITLDEMKAEIAGVEREVAAGDGSDAYRACIYEKHMWERQFNAKKRPDGTYPYGRYDESIGSGQPAGARAHTYQNDPELEPEFQTVGEFFVAGRDQALFVPRLSGAFDTARPLPAGEYKFNPYYMFHSEILCDAIPEAAKKRVEVFVAVTAPSGTAHEAFFDPVAIGTAVGADAANGVLDAAGFTVGGAATTIDGLKWEGGTLTLELSPAASLIGHALDFIALDGSVTLSLDGGAATVSGGTLTWSVADQPWQAGDLLMLRIRTGSPA